MIPLEIEITKLAERQYQGRIIGTTIRALPSEIDFFIEIPDPQGRGPTGEEAAYVFGHQGGPLPVETGPVATKELADPIILAMVLLDRQITRQGGSLRATFSIPYSEDGSPLYQPVQTALRMNGLIE